MDLLSTEAVDFDYPLLLLLPPGLPRNGTDVQLLHFDRCRSSLWVWFYFKLPKAWKPGLRQNFWRQFRVASHWDIDCRATENQLWEKIFSLTCSKIILCEAFTWNFKNSCRKHCFFIASSMLPTIWTRLLQREEFMAGGILAKHMAPSGTSTRSAQAPHPPPPPPPQLCI